MKKTLIVLAYILCICAMLFSICWFVPYLRYRVLRIPIETETFLPKPDEIVVAYGDKEFVLNDVQRKTLYRLFADVAVHINRYERGTAEKKINKQELRWEFRYHCRYKYTGTLYSERAAFEKPFSFDAITMACYDGMLQINPQLYGIEYSIEGKSTCLDFAPYREYDWELVLQYALSAYTEQLLQMVPKQKLGVLTDKSNAFPAMPDSAVICRDGKTVEVTGEALESLYAQFFDMVDHQSCTVVQAPDDFAHVQERLLETTCIEFRYLKRQKYAASSAAREEGPYAIGSRYSGIEYDALLFSLPDDGMKNLTKIVYCNGEYRWQEMLSHEWGYDHAVYGELTQYLDTLLD
ncbi:MAG: hypothetical protein IJW51_03500 [Clostridia bacterium]|nr:hypothetical protein [Clostridia bacterium]